MCTENGCETIIVSSLLKWNNYKRIDCNCPVLKFSFNLLIFWTLTKHNSYAILHNVFGISQPYSLCISHPNLTLHTDTLPQTPNSERLPCKGPCKFQEQ